MNEGITNAFWYAVVRGLALITAAVLGLTGCTKQTFELSEDTPISGTLDPAFAVPLMHGSWSFGDALESLELPVQMETASTGSLTAVFPFGAFETEPIGLLPVTETAQVNWVLDTEQAAALSAMPAGQSIELVWNTPITWPFPAMAEMDSLWLGSGALNVALNSNAPLAVGLSGTCANLFIGSAPLQLELNAAPNEGAVTGVPTDGAVLEGNSTNAVELQWDWTLVLVSTGEEVQEGASIGLQIAFESVAVEAAFGAFPTNVAHPIEAAVELPEFASWDPALFYLSEPQLVLNVWNSFGVGMELNVSELALLTSSNALLLTGPAVDSFPELAGAEFMGDTAWTEHVLNNAGLDPSLSELMNLAPDSLKLTGTIGALEAGSGGHFAASSDVLGCSGRLEIPLAGWATGVRWRDTIASPISQDLQAAIASPFDWTDAYEVTLRFIIENGWPLDLEGHVVFINAEGDSLSAGPSLMIPGGEPLTQTMDPLGHAVVPTLSTVDLVLERALALELMAMDCTGTVVSFDMSTSQSQNGQEVRMFSQDLLSLKLAAKVECQIDANP